jgi:hypothetical protein
MSSNSKRPEYLPTRGTKGTFQIDDGMKPEIDDSDRVRCKREDALEFEGGVGCASVLGGVAKRDERRSLLGRIDGVSLSDDGVASSSSLFSALKLGPSRRNWA